MADETQATYERLVARRHDETGDPALWERLSGRRLIDVDLHMHTDHSGDCATPVTRRGSAAPPRIGSCGRLSSARATPKRRRAG